MLMTGGSGLLGGAVRTLRPAVVAPSRAALDVTDAGQVEAALDRSAPAIVLHAAAVVGSGECEADAERCVAVNIEGTYHLAMACRRRGIRFVYVSTDYVFDGRRGLYREDDPVNPIALYGRTKLAGEMIALALPGALVVRTSFHPDRSWKFPTAFVDQYCSRLPVSSAAAQILEAAESPLTGVIHIGGPRRSLYEIASDIRGDVTPIRRDDSPVPVPRDVSLDSTRWTRFRRARPERG